MRKTSEGRNPGDEWFDADKGAAQQRWHEHYSAKVAAAKLAIDQSNSTLEKYKLLILVDVQGMFLALHKWLSERNFPIDDGLISVGSRICRLGGPPRRSRGALLRIAPL